MTPPKTAGLTKQGVRNLDPPGRNGRRDAGQPVERRQRECAHQWAGEFGRAWGELWAYYERCVICGECRR